MTFWYAYLIPFWSLIALLGCGQPGPTVSASGLANSFGSLDRRPLLASDPAVFRSVGKLVRPNGRACTAVLIGDDLALTAAHCIAEGDQPQKGNYRFLLGYSAKGAQRSSRITHFWWGEIRGARGQDWALLRLESPLGASVSFAQLGEFDAGQHVDFVGYGDDFQRGQVLTAHRQCQIRDRPRVHEMYHDCDSANGDSGGALFQCNSGKCRLVGIHVAAYQKQSDRADHYDNYQPIYANIAVSSTAFQQKFASLQP